MNKLHQQNLSWLQLVGGVESQTFEESPFSEIHIFASVEESRVDEPPRSYSPYLIAYHEDTNSFTFTDPWVQVQVDQTSHISSKDNEISLNVNDIVTSHEVQFAHESVPLQSPIAQEQIICEAIDNGIEKLTQHREAELPKTVEVVVEHVPKVSLPHDEHSLRHLLEVAGDF